jgi:hypothetical protein
MEIKKRQAGVKKSSACGKTCVLGGVSRTTCTQTVGPSGSAWSSYSISIPKCFQFMPPSAVFV